MTAPARRVRSVLGVQMRIGRLALVSIFAVSLLVAGCATSRIESAWSDPSATAQSLAFRQVLTLARARDGAIRRRAEDALERTLEAGARAQSGEMKIHPGCTILDDRDLGDVAIYSLREDKLLWSAVSRTLNPSQIDEVVTAVAQAAGEEFRARGLLP